MATQVADQPPAARFDDEALSPVSKLEAARRAAAIEQQKRVDAAYARLASKKDKKEPAGKRKALEARLDAGGKSKLQKTVVDASDKSPNSISRRLMDRFQADPEPEQENLNPAAEKVTRSISTQFVSRTTTVTTTSTDNNGDVVVATSAKLDEVISKTKGVSETPVPEENDNNDENLPSTAFHAKQLGLTDEKVDIYAPPEVQQQELRKIRERALYLPPQPKTIATLETKSDSEADSDFTPEDSDSDISGDSEISDVESVDPAETKELEVETQEFALSEAAKASAARRNALKWFFVWVPLYVIGLCLLLLAVLFLIDWSQERYEFCPVDSAASDDSESLLSCEAFVGAQATVKSFLREALENARASVEQYLP